MPANIRKHSTLIALTPPPPIQASKLAVLAVLEPPILVVKTQQLSGFAAIAPRPPVRVFAGAGYAVVEPPPPIRSGKVTGYAALKPLPVAFVSFSLTGYAALIPPKPKVYKLTPYSVMVPLSGIGLRARKKQSHAVLSPPAITAGDKQTVVVMY